MNPLLLPMAAHVALTALLYVLLTIVRAPKIWGIGQNADGSNPWATVEPRISANLSNQFEWPVFFYAACLLLMHSQNIPTGAIWLAWLFILGRLIHSGVQIFTTNAPAWRSVHHQFSGGDWSVAVCGAITPLRAVDSP